MGNSLETSSAVRDKVKVGSIVASCGCTLKPDENTVSVCYRDEACDAVEGFHPVLVYAEFCPRCTKTWAERGDLFSSKEEGELWLSQAEHFTSSQH